MASTLQDARDKLCEVEQAHEAAREKCKEAAKELENIHIEFRKTHEIYKSMFEAHCVLEVKLQHAKNVVEGLERAKEKVKKAKEALDRANRNIINAENGRAEDEVCCTGNVIQIAWQRFRKAQGELKELENKQ